MIFALVIQEGVFMSSCSVTSAGDSLAQEVQSVDRLAHPALENMSLLLGWPLGAIQIQVKYIAITLYNISYWGFPLSNNTEI